MAEKAKSKLQEAKEKLEKNFGKGTLINGSSKPEVCSVVSTGSLNLDNATGIRGLPYGKLVEFMGWEASGKSTTTLYVIRNHQQKKDGRKALLIDGEHSFDRVYAAKLGVDVDDIEICQPDYGEMGYDVANELISTGEIGVCVIDSQTSLLPKKVMQGEAEDKNLGLHARLMSTEMPKLLSTAARNNCLIIVISQFREKIGVMYGSPVTTSGGNALKFYAHMRLEFSRSFDKEEERSKTKVVIKKNKLAPPFKEAEFYIDWGKGINRNGEILDLAVEYGIIKKGGSWFTYGDNKMQGEDNILKIMEDNEEFRQEIEEKVMKILYPHPEKINLEDFPIIYTPVQISEGGPKLCENETDSIQCDQDSRRDNSGEHPSA